MSCSFFSLLWSCNPSLVLFPTPVDYYWYSSSCFFTLGHDCGHYSFAKQRWVNEVAGHLLLLPLLYPFHNWCIEYNCHHNRTNKLGGPHWKKQLHDILNGKVDLYWHPFRTEVYAILKPSICWIYRLTKGSLWWLATTMNWWKHLTLDVSKFSTRIRSRVRLSIAVVLIFAGTVFPIIIATI